MLPRPPTHTDIFPLAPLLSSSSPPPLLPPPLLLKQHISHSQAHMKICHAACIVFWCWCSMQKYDESIMWKRDKAERCERETCRILKICLCAQKTLHTAECTCVPVFRRRRFTLYICGLSLSVFKMTPSIDFRLLCQAGAEVEGVARWVEVVRCPPDRAKRLLRVSAALCPLKASPHLQPICSLRTFWGPSAQ